MSGTYFAHTDTTQNVPFEMGQVQWLRNFGDNGNQTLAAGIWYITPEEAPEPFELPINEHETIYIISGHLKITVDGVEHNLTAGSMMSFSPGSHSIWQVLEPTKEFFVYS